MKGEIVKTWFNVIEFNGQTCNVPDGENQDFGDLVSRCHGLLYRSLSPLSEWFRASSIAEAEEDLRSTWDCLTISMNLQCSDGMRIEIISETEYKLFDMLGELVLHLTLKSLKPEDLAQDFKSTYLIGLFHGRKKSND